MTPSQVIGQAGGLVGTRPEGTSLADWLDTRTKETSKVMGDLHQSVKDDAKAKNIELQRLKIAQARAKLKALAAQARAAAAAGDVERAKSIARQIGVAVKEIRSAMSALKAAGGSAADAGPASSEGSSTTASEGSENQDGDTGEGSGQEGTGGEAASTPPPPTAAAQATIAQTAEQEKADRDRRLRAMERDRQLGLMEGASGLAEARSALEELQRLADRSPDTADAQELDGILRAVRQEIRAEGPTSLWV
jgi:hypothetical protein